MMKIVKIMGGLGNQMFQYALFCSFLQKGYTAKLDITAFEHNKFHNGFQLKKAFDINPTFASKKEVKLYSRDYETPTKFLRYFKRLLPPKRSEYREKAFIYDKHLFDNNDKVYYLGYWIDERYFEDIKRDIITTFTFTKDTEEQNKKILLKLKNTETVGLHIRRGDYFKNKRNAKFYGNICTQEYYQKAIDFIHTKTNKPLFVVFSDDIDWVNSNLLKHIGTNCLIVDWNKGKKSFNDMMLMSCCKHNIIANSTFSWWGAWLNKNPDKIVIAPDKWVNLNCVNNVIPVNWIKMGKN